MSEDDVWVQQIEYGAGRYDEVNKGIMRMWKQIKEVQEFLPTFFLNSVWYIP